VKLILVDLYFPFYYLIYVCFTDDKVKESYMHSFYKLHFIYRNNPKTATFGYQNTKGLTDSFRRQVYYFRLFFIITATTYLPSSFIFSLLLLNIKSITVLSTQVHMPLQGSPNRVWQTPSPPPAS
jgi:hypothetical protein